MPRIGVVTDSTADFPGDARERLGIEMVPLSVTWDTDTFRDKIDLSIDEFYAMMRSRSTCPTTPRRRASSKQTYSGLLERVDHIISVHLAVS